MSETPTTTESECPGVGSYRATHSGGGSEGGGEDTKILRIWTRLEDKVRRYDSNRVRKFQQSGVGVWATGKARRNKI